MPGRTFAPHPAEMIERCQVCGVDPCECQDGADEKDIVCEPPEAPGPDYGKFASTISEIESQCMELESIALRDAEIAKASKKNLESRIADLRRTIRKFNEKLPLLDGKEPQEGSATASTDAPPSPEWADVAVDILITHGVSMAISNKLADAGIETLGQLAAWNDGTKNLTDIPGIGQAKADKIRDALEGFWADWHGKHAEPAPSSNGDVTEGTS